MESHSFPWTDKLAERSPGLASAANSGAEARLRGLMEKLSEAEFQSIPSADLARRCGCSERHFNRLFRACYGSSLRAKQIELGLKKAGRLLRETDGKVVHVAVESGFRHLGLFNLLFKKHFGKTPRQWREKRKSLHSSVVSRK